MMPLPLKISKYYRLHLRTKTTRPVYTTSSLYLKAASAESRVPDHTGAAVHRPWSACVEWIRSSRVVEAAYGGTFVPGVLSLLRIALRSRAAVETTTMCCGDKSSVLISTCFALVMWHAVQCVPQCTSLSPWLPTAARKYYKQRSIYWSEYTD